MEYFEIEIAIQQGRKIHTGTYIQPSGRKYKATQTFPSGFNIESMDDDIIVLEMIPEALVSL